MATQYCRHCHHPEDVHDIHGTGECGCGCIRLVAVDREAREARKRTWLVAVKMFVRNRWIESGEMRIKSGGAANAAAVGMRQARRDCLKPRTRVEQITIAITPVGRSRAGR